jgi:uncharacterized protein (DUF58 family)
VLLAVDVSGSMAFGTQARRKREVAGELAAVLAFTAIGNNDRVGLMQFTDHIEHYLPPDKGSTHVLRLIRDVLFREPTGRRTSLSEGLDHLNRVQRKPAIVFLFSDFFDLDFEQALRRTARRHDLIAVRLSDPREQALPAVGRALFRDAETGRSLEVDLSDRRERQRYEEAARSRADDLRRLMLAAGVDLIEATTGGGHVEELVAFFRRRRHRRTRRRTS